MLKLTDPIKTLEVKVHFKSKKVWEMYVNLVEYEKFRNDIDQKRVLCCLTDENGTLHMINVFSINNIEVFESEDIAV